MAAAGTSQPGLDFDGLRPPTPGLKERHASWRSTVRAFVNEEIAPNIDAWDAAGTFPDAIYERAVAAGIFGMGFPASFGGVIEDADLYHRIIFAEELHRLGSGVVFADLATHWIGLPPVIGFGASQLHDTVVRPVLAGQQRIAFAVTEPSGGSDVSRLMTSAERHGDHWLVNGEKTLISGGLRADYVLTAVRTGGAGMGGISLLLIDAASPGITRAPVTGLGWYNSSIASMSLRDVSVPAGRLIGEENKGFAALTRQFNIERFSGIAATLAMSRVALAEAIRFAAQRETFGKRLVEHQVIRHKLVDMAREVHAAYGYLDQCVWRFENGDVPIADLCMLKVHATTTLESCAREALHILGGSAYTGSHRLERIYREARIFAVGGGTEEVLRDLAARQLGL